MLKMSLKDDRTPCVWWDRAVGGFYLSEESIPASILATPDRIVALSPHREEDFHICVSVDPSGCYVAVYDGEDKLHEQFYENPVTP